MTNPDESASPIFLQNGLTHDCHVDIGLTKREYFAAIQPQIVDEFSQESMIIIMGSEPPSDRLENIKWWLLAESTIRVMKADALIEALKKKRKKRDGKFFK